MRSTAEAITALGSRSKASCERKSASLALPYAIISSVASAAVATLLDRAASRTDAARRFDLRCRTLELRLRERRHRLRCDDARSVPAPSRSVARPLRV